MHRRRRLFSPKKFKKNSTHLLPCGFVLVVSEPVKPYFIRFLRVLTFCLGVSNGVVFLRKWCSKMQDKICHRAEKEQVHESEEAKICCYINKIQIKHTFK